MLALARWCIAHRRRVVVIWIVFAVAISVIAQAVGRDYSNNFTLPGTESQRAVNLLQKRFPSQSGDLDQIVWHTGRGTVRSAEVKAAIEPLLEKVSRMPYVTGVVSPYSSAGAAQISKDERTAFANISYAKRANLLPKSTGTELLDAVEGVRCPACRLPPEVRSPSRPSRRGSASPRPLA